MVGVYIRHGLHSIALHWGIGNGDLYHIHPSYMYVYSTSNSMLGFLGMR